MHDTLRTRALKLKYKKKMEFLIDNTFVVFCDKVFQQCVGNPMGKNCAPC